MAKIRIQNKGLIKYIEEKDLYNYKKLGYVKVEPVKAEPVKKETK